MATLLTVVVIAGFIPELGRRGKMAAAIAWAMAGFLIFNNAKVQSEVSGAVARFFVAFVIAPPSVALGLLLGSGLVAAVTSPLAMIIGKIGGLVAKMVAPQPWKRIPRSAPT